MFNKHNEFVIKCQEVGEKTTDDDAQAEFYGTITKLKSLLDGKVREEVDYEEACKEASLTFLLWSNRSPVGDKAFVANINDRDETIVALDKHNKDMTERDDVEKEWEKEFGDDGVALRR